MEGVIFDIQRGSMNDGPGIRTTVFLKGCPLNCLWCHNEESISGNPQLRFFVEKCTHCLDCVAACRAGAHFEKDGEHRVAFEKCTRNWDCIHICPSEALIRSGERMNAIEVMDIFLKDKEYYQNSGGGITLSGGEPLVQFDFSLELLRLAARNNIHTCVDTSGHAASDKYKALIPFTNLFLFDYKATGEALHKKLTGVDNKLILKNLEVLESHNSQVILRCPMVPGVNDNEEHLRKIARYSRDLKCIREIQILPYHKMGKGKKEQYGLQQNNKEFKEPTTSLKSAWGKSLKAYNARNFTIF